MNLRARYVDTKPEKNHEIVVKTMSIMLADSSKAPKVYEHENPQDHTQVPP